MIDQPFDLPSEANMFDLTDRVAEFMHARFLKYLANNPPEQGPVPPMDFDIHLLTDIELLARRAAQAYEHRIQVHWDADRYAEHLSKRPTGQNDKEEERLDSRFPPDPALEGELLTEPAVLVDKYNRILAWYLPHALSTHRQLCLWRYISYLDSALQGTVSQDDTAGWRSSPQYFREPGTCQPHPGNLNVSPAWFQQAHDTARDSLEISAPLKPGSADTGTMTFLKAAAESFSLMGAFLFIVHPELYEAGRQVFRTIIANPGLVKEDAAVLDVLRYWTSPFSGYGVISNRITPFHRDNNSRAQWFDLLTTLGTYEGSRLVLANLEVELQYDAGTMVALLGKILRHGVPETRGDRVCIAQYMRDNVHARTGVKAPGWTVWGNYPTSKVSQWDPNSVMNLDYMKE